MLLISHRGNLEFQDFSKENTIPQIEKAIEYGFDVEIDVWKIEKNLFLGHDFGINLVNVEWMENNKNKLWIHCKNLEAFKFLDSEYDFNLFVHDDEPVVITTKGYRWYYPGNDSSGGICVLPEKFNKSIPNKTIGICTDYPYKFKNH